MTLRYSAEHPDEGLRPEPARPLHGPWLAVARLLDLTGGATRAQLRDAMAGSLNSTRFSQTIDLMRKHRLLTTDDGVIRLAPRGVAALRLNQGAAERPPLTPRQTAD